MPLGAAEIVTTLIPVAKAKDIVDRLKDQQDANNKVLERYYRCELFYVDVLSPLQRHMHWGIHPRACLKLS